MADPLTLPDSPLQGRLTSSAEELVRSMQANGFRGWSTLGLEAGRAAILEMRTLGGMPEHVARVEEVLIYRADGSALTGEIYIPDSIVPRPAMLYMHGGGFALGNHTAVDSLVRMLANRSGCTMLSIDYRLAPEHKYPAALEDAQSALNWLIVNADNWGLDRTRLAVGGDSSGANLAAAVSLLCRDRGGPKLAFQLLVYPALDANCATESYRRFGDGSSSLLSHADVVWFQNHYVNCAEELEDAYVSPLRATSFIDLPRTLLVLAEIDPLFDEGLNYADRLRAENIPIEIQIYPGMFHGFWRAGGVLSDARLAVESVANRIRLALSM